MSQSPEARFAERLRARRKARGLSLDRFASELSTQLDKTALARIERGERGIKVDEAVAIAAVLGVPLAHLLDPGVDADDQEIELRRARYALDDAQVLLRRAEEEVERREQVVEEAAARVQELQQRDLLDDLRAG